MIHASALRPPRAPLAALQALFFASGFVALLYQVIWQRMLGLVTGLDLYAVTLVVSVFMVGLGLGSFAGGRLADRLPPSRLLAVFAGAECVIAAFALISRPLYYDGLLGLAAEQSRSPTLIAALGASTILVPTFCMGITLPLLSRAVTSTAAAAAQRVAGLYGWNTLGAAFGAWAGSAVLVRAIGYENSLWVGAGVNVACAGTTMWLRRRLVGDAPDVQTEAASIPETAPSALPDTDARWPWRAWLLLYFVSGFVALGLEMVWFRLLGVTLKSTTYTFPLLLGFYLTGVGAGSLVGRYAARRGRHPLRWFLLAQAAIPVYAGLSIAALLRALERADGLATARAYLASYEPIDFTFNFSSLASRDLTLYLIAPAYLILPPTVLMGVSFACLQRGVQLDTSGLGRRVGSLQTANIAGSTAGVIVVGVLMLGFLGTAGTLRALTGVSGLYLACACVAALAPAPRPVRWASVAVSLAAAVWIASLLPAADRFWGAFHGVTADRILHYEDGTGLAVLTSPDRFFRRRADVYVNGLGQSSVPFGGVHSFLGLVPVLLHPSPRDVAIIGLGSGDTAYSAAGRPETERIQCVEIIGGQVRTLRALHQRTGYQGLGGLLDDPRLRIITGDGRRYVMQSRDRFDIIEADALRPSSAYSGTLYSREYFELLRDRLKPGGFAVTWAPTPRIHDTFRAVFGHVVEVPPMLIGSNEPIAFRAETVRQRAAHPQTVQHYRRAGIDLEAHLEQMLATIRHREPPPAPAVPAMMNTDLFPRDELRTP